MKLFLFACFLAVANSSTDIKISGAQAKQETHGLDGNWQCVQYSEFPGAAPGKVAAKIKIRFTGMKAILDNGKETLTFSVMMNLTKKPAEIDLLAKDGAAKGKRLLGLFILSNDELKIQLGNSDVERPKWDESGRILMSLVLKRMK